MLFPRDGSLRKPRKRCASIAFSYPYPRSPGLARWIPRARRALGSAVDPLRYCSDDVLDLPFEKLRDGPAPSAPWGRMFWTCAGTGIRKIDPVCRAKSLDRSPALYAGSGVVGASSTNRPMDGVRARLARDPQSEILVTLGATGVLQTALATFVNRGDRVVVFRTDLAAVRNPGGGEGRCAFSASPGAWKMAKSGSGSTAWQSCCAGAIIVLANPANPQGGVFCDADLEQIAWWAAKRDALIYSDDVFAPFIYDQPSTNIGCLPRAFRHALGGQRLEESLPTGTPRRVVNGRSQSFKALCRHRGGADDFCARALPANRRQFVGTTR